MPSRTWRVHQQILRIIDANINRVSEGLRVLEDVSRFYLQDAEISRELKAIRHYFNSLAQDFGPVLLDARDAECDIGAGHDLVQQHDTSSIIRANAKRAQESIRVLEELSKLTELKKLPSWDSLKKYRYKLYTIEKRIITDLSEHQY